MQINAINNSPFLQPELSKNDSKELKAFQALVPVEKHSKKLVCKITKMPILGPIINAIIWLFKKIFPCCFRKVIPSTEHLFRKFINNYRTKKILAEILEAHPSWKNAADTWKVSLKDKVWLLMLYELHHMKSGKMEKGTFIKNTSIPELSRYPVPSSRTPELLLCKKEIEQFLSSIDKITVQLDKKLTKCPKGICLLENLEELVIFDCNLKEPPDTRWNTKLKHIDLTYNVLTQPPNVSWNKELETLLLNYNKLIIPPIVNKNEKLEYLDLEVNQLTTSPDLSKNANLKYLVLNENRLKEAPELSKNKNLELLALNSNQITVPPNVKFHADLAHLYINDNPLEKLSDFSDNGNINLVSANNCKLKIAPSFGKNPNMKMLFLDNNCLDTLPELYPNHNLVYFTIKNNRLPQSVYSQLPANPSMSWPKYATYPHCYGL